MDTPFEEQFDQVLALIPVSKGADPQEQFLTNMDVDFAAEAGNKSRPPSQLIRILTVVLCHVKEFFMLLNASISRILC